MSPKSMKKPPDPNPTLPNYQSIKTSLKSVVRNDVIIDKLQEATKRANTIMTHGLHFLKLYMLHCYETGVPFPVLDKDFVKEVLKVSRKVATSGRPAGEKANTVKKLLREFYDEHYKAYVSEEIPFTYMDTAVSHMAVEVITMYENNIKAHFVEYVERFVNVAWDKKDALMEIKNSDASSNQKQSMMSALCTQLRNMKTDLLSPSEEKTSDVMYHSWIDKQRPHVVPTRVLKEKVYYDICCSPQNYLPCMLYMMRHVEVSGQKASSVFPLRSDLIPKHFRMNTTTLVYLCMTKYYGTQGSTPLRATWYDTNDASGTSSSRRT
eukprot:NODE_5_length_49639_cov_0.484336.p13 type:complete len:322 gc:universal NODE_5_length_49639_cov_0.484336:40963-39998(-)